VKVWVDRDGVVRRAETSQVGTNIASGALQNKCEEAAKTARFNPAPDAPELQVGNIFFVFHNQ
jgi:hypothetical protein